MNDKLSKYINNNTNDIFNNVASESFNIVNQKLN